MNSPFCLSDSGTIIATLTQAYLSSKDSIQVGAQGLQAKYIHQPVQIRALRFLATCQQLAVSTKPQVTPAAYIRVRIKVGRHYLTQGFVPLSVLSQRISNVIEFSSSPGASGTVWSSTSRVTWRFDRPLPMAPGEAIQCDFMVQYPDGQVPAILEASVGPWTINVVAVGESIDKMPQTYPVPLALSWVPVPGQTQTGENDLRNMNASIFEIRRMVGRSFVGLYYNGAPNGSPADEYWTDYDQFYSYASSPVTTPFGIVSDPSKTATFNLYDENNRSLLSQSNATWSQAFPEESLCWPMTKKMHRGWSWRMTLGQIPAIVSSDPGWIPMVGLIGFREERAS